MSDYDAPYIRAPGALQIPRNRLYNGTDALIHQKVTLVFGGLTGTPSGDFDLYLYQDGRLVLTPAADITIAALITEDATLDAASVAALVLIFKTLHITSNSALKFYSHPTRAWDNSGKIISYVLTFNAGVFTGMATQDLAVSSAYSGAAHAGTGWYKGEPIVWHLPI